MSRGLQPTVVRKFRGLNVWTSLAAVTPDQATALLNVIPSSDGTVGKLRIPTVLGSAGHSDQPCRFKQYANSAGTRQVIAQQDLGIFAYDTAWAITIVDVDSLNHALYDFIEANNLFFGTNGVKSFKWDGVTHSKWGIDAPATAPALGTVSGGSLTFVNGGRTYIVSYGNSITGHVSNGSPVSASTGNLLNQEQEVDCIAPTDQQVDIAYLFSTVDGGGTYYFNQSVAVVPLTAFSFTDNTPDANLNFAVVAPTINNPPPLGLYLANFQGRVIIMNLDDDPQGAAYSGYEWILLGRPEESYPPSNRLRLAIGADDMRGGGGVANGFVFFSRSDQMFFLRGTLQDITTVAPVQITTFLQQLPWQQGCFSHFSIQSTPQGLVWLGSDKTIQIFDGTNEPKCLSISISPILRTITAGTEDNARSAYFNFLERMWYCLAVSVNGSFLNNQIIVIDLDPNPDTNCGIFLSDLRADDMCAVDDADGMRQLVIDALGVMYKFLALSDAVGGVSNPITSTSGILPGYWQSGPFGNEDSNVIKMFRWVNVVTDQSNFKVQTFMIGEDNNFRYPTLLPPGGPAPLPASGKVPVNTVGRRAMYLIQFPQEDVSANLLELTNQCIPVAQR